MYQTYRTFIRQTSYENPSNIQRKSIYRTSIETPVNIYTKSIEHHSRTQRTTDHATEIEKSKCLVVPPPLAHWHRQYLPHSQCVLAEHAIVAIHFRDPLPEASSELNTGGIPGKSTKQNNILIFYVPSG